MGNDMSRMCTGGGGNNDNKNDSKNNNNDDGGVNDDINTKEVNNNNNNNDTNLIDNGANMDDNNNEGNNNNTDNNIDNNIDNNNDDNPLNNEVCAHCNEKFALDGSQEVLNFDENYYHVEHFVCWHCGVHLDQEDATPIIYKDRLWCGEDYSRALKKREKKRKCAGCTKKIKKSQEPIVALNKSWHQHCVKCYNCKQILKENGIYHETGDFQSGDHIFCRKHFLDRFADRCAGCTLPLKGGAVCKLAGRTFHADCFKCSECKHPLREKFCVKDELIYCKEDFDRLFGLRCFKCNNILEGKFHNAFGHLYHQKCFTCHECGERLRGARFDKDPDGDELYCENDYKKVLRQRQAKLGAALYS